MNRKWLLLLLASLLMLSGCGKDTAKFDEYVTKGNKQLSQENFEMAVNLFEKALKLKPEDKKIVKLLKKARDGLAKQKDRAKALAYEENLTDEIYNLKVKESEGKFFINDITLLMTKDEIIEKWGEPDSAGRPDPDIEFEEGIYENWNVMSYGDIQMTFYSDILKYVKITPNDYVFETPWYGRLGKPDEMNDDGYIFYSDDQYIIFSDYEYEKGPVIMWRETDPEPLPVENDQVAADNEPMEEEAQEETAADSLVNGMDVFMFAEEFNSRYDSVYQKFNGPYKEKYGVDLDRTTLIDDDINIDGNDFKISINDETVMSGQINEINTITGIGLISYVRGSMPKDEEQEQKDWENTIQKTIIMLTMVKASDPSLSEEDVDDIVSEIYKQHFKESKETADLKINGLEIIDQTDQDKHVSLFAIKVQ